MENALRVLVFGLLVMGAVYVFLASRLRTSCEESAALWNISWAYYPSGKAPPSEIEAAYENCIHRDGLPL